MNQNHKAVLVIGGSGGIGKAIVNRLLDRQLAIVLATYNTTQPPSREGAYWFKLDVMEDWPEKINMKLHSIELAALIYCAGQASSKKTVVDTPDNEWTSLFEVNCLGFIRCYRQLVTTARRCHSRVVVVSSDVTRCQGPQNGPYSVSKMALECVAVTLAKEEAEYGVRVSIIAPSLVDSPMCDRLLRIKGINNKQEYSKNLPWGRLLAPSEVADAVVSLAVDDCWAYASGQVFRLAAEV